MIGKNPTVDNVPIIKMLFKERNACVHSTANFSIAADPDWRSVTDLEISEVDMG